MGTGVLHVPVLVGLERAGDIAGKPRGDAVVGLGRFGRHVGGAEDDLRAVRAEQRLLLDRLLVGHHEDAAIALEGGSDRQAVAGVSAGRLDDRPAGFQETGSLSRLDHGEADAILDGAARIEHLHLGEQERLAIRRAEVAGDPAKPDERRVTDEVEDRLDVAHRGGV
jgi:hypothetical protein